IYKKCDQYEELGFTPANAATLSNLKESFEEASNSLMIKINELHDLNAKIREKEKLLTEGFFQGKRDLDQKEISAAAEEKEREEKRIATEKKLTRTDREKV